MLVALAALGLGMLEVLVGNLKPQLHPPKYLSYRRLEVVVAEAAASAELAVVVEAAALQLLGL